MQCDGDLVFAVYNEKKATFGGFKQELVGQFALKLKNIRATNIRLEREEVPENSFFEFYNIVKECEVKGRILGFFDLRPCDEKMQEEADKQHEEEKERKLNMRKDFDDKKATKGGLTQKNVEQVKSNSTDVKIKISAMCLRNLNSSAKKPRLSFKLTNEPSTGKDDKGHEIKPNEKLEDQESTCNPYILGSVSFDANVADNLLDWPYLKIKFYDEAFFGSGDGYSTLLLFPYATSFLQQKDVDSTLLTFNTQVEANKTKQRAGSSQKGSAKGSKLSSRSSRTISGSGKSKKDKAEASEFSAITEEDEENEEDNDQKIEEVQEKEEEDKKEDQAKEKTAEETKEDKEKKKKEVEEDKLVEEDKDDQDKVIL